MKSTSHRIRLAGSASRGRRGSTLLLVLALLSVLVLLATTLTFTARLEVLSSFHYGKAVQLRTAVLTGVDDGGLALLTALPQGGVGPLDFAFDENLMKRRPGPMGEQAAIDHVTSNAHLEANVLRHQQVPAELADSFQPMVRVEPLWRTGNATTLIEDANARLNLNTASHLEIARLFLRIAEKNSGDATHRALGLIAGSLAGDIVERRFGPDGAPGVAGEDDNRNAVHATELLENGKLQELLSEEGDEAAQYNPLLTGVDEIEEYIADIRYAPFGDDLRIETLGDLLEFEGCTPEILQLIEPYVTVFSMTYDTAPEASGFTPLVDVNRASAGEIYATLRREYGSDKNDTLLAQYAVNVVDSRDGDSIPTAMMTNQGEMIYGLEKTPFISEVYPDARTPDERGDDGQYVEICNPWGHRIDISDMTLEVGGRRVALKGALEPWGCIIVTDDYDNARDPGAKEDLPGTGSFYDIFGVLHRAPQYRILEDPLLNIPHTPGSFPVRLKAGSGELLDEFVYTIPSGEAWSTLNSIQRVNLVDRGWMVVARATPFGMATKNQTLMMLPDSLVRDMPFTGAGQLFQVSTLFAGRGNTDLAYFTFPVPVSPVTTTGVGRDLALDPETLDARIVDLFTARTAKHFTPDELERDGWGSEDKKLVDPWADGLEISATGKKDVSEDDWREAESLAYSRYSPPRMGWFQGLINLNTAPEEVLAAAGFTDEAIDHLQERREEAIRLAVDGGVGDGLAYRSLSEFIGDSPATAGWRELSQRMLTPDLESATLESYLQTAGLLGTFLEADTDTEGHCPTPSPMRVVSFSHGFPFTVSTRSFFFTARAMEESEADAPDASPVGMRALVVTDRDSAEIVEWSYTQ